MADGDPPKDLDHLGHLDLLWTGWGNICPGIILFEGDCWQSYFEQTQHGNLSPPREETYSAYPRGMGAPLPGGMPLVKSFASQAEGKGLRNI